MNLKEIILAILFYWTDPIEDIELSNITKADIKDIQSALDEIKKEFNEKNRGIILKKIENSYQLVTNPNFFNYIKKLTYKEEEKKINNSSMETLSIIAYKQPITRIEIDKVRGVNSQSSINTLLGRNLIEESGRLDAPGKPILYKTTKEFLRVFNLESLDKLPIIEKDDVNEIK
ncbi:SMC-Scp complex subunit ScpB [Citroniella saccharovorans]|uniref:SMC-Scp complex subunit ScpB n=1 Tax=Citroniella saccharovorans TaxID=2053367 RepID=A0AAW9MU51_9FIRM|nr:SMC-Scp complex subunit ScpB [Citroniella saccharovorans]MEB3429601.1 SMC-Scp complex subunit ScpB [Citroniella saccharovorans]